MKKNFTLLIIVLLAATLDSLSQVSLQPLSFQSPEASSLMREVTTPVSLSSGTVNIGIPLYILKCGQIEVPISMQYDASGVKVDAQPSWVGQNWSLKAGGMISRIVKGAPDETYNEEEIFLTIGGENHLINRHSVGLLYNTDKLRASNWNTTNQIDSWAKNGYFELEPDEFVFNFCGQTGKFYVNELGKLISTDPRYRVDAVIYNNIPMYNNTIGIDPEKPESYTYYKKNMMVTSQGNIGGFVRLRVSRIIGFCITSADGVKYYFGMFYKDEKGILDYKNDHFREVEITANFFSQFFQEEFSTWYLERIVSPQGDVVEFKYEKGDPTVSFSSDYSMNKMSGSAASGLGWFFGGKVSSGTFYAGQNVSGKFIRPVFLSEIRSPYESLKFKIQKSSTLRYNYSFIYSHLILATKYYDPNVFIPSYYGQYPITKGFDHFGRQIIDFNLLKTSKLDEISINSITDHLGNVRAVLDPSKTVVQKTDYFPFGLTHVVSNLNKNKYLFGGKEIQDELSLNMYDFHARQQDPIIGRFTSIDPMTEKYYGFSSYNYCANNPINAIDPTGMDWWLNNETGEYEYLKDKKIWHQEDMTTHTYQGEYKLWGEVFISMPEIFNSYQDVWAPGISINGVQYGRQNLGGSKNIEGYHDGGNTGELTADHIGVTISGSMLVGTGFTFDLSLGHVKDRGWYLGAAPGFGAGYDLSASIGLTFGRFIGRKEDYSIRSIKGGNASGSLSLGLIALSLSGDYVSESKKIGQNWQNIGFGAGLGVGSFKGGISNTFILWDKKK